LKPNVPDAWGFSLFCDDLRNEIGGKISIMGVYGPDMVFQEQFPLVLTKFAILIKYYERPGAFKDDIIFQIYMPGDVKGSPAITNVFKRDPTISSLSPTYDLDEDQAKVFNLTLPFMFSTLPVPKEGFIKVRAVCGGITTNLGSLMLRSIRADEKIPGLNA
jgi:hypothetical protein